MFDDTCTPAETPPEAPDEAPLTVTVETYPDAPDECTLYPANAARDTLLTTWLSAEAGSFVALDEMR